MIYENYFWTELTYDKHSYVAPSGEILVHVTYDSNARVYRVEDKEFISLDAAKIFAIATLQRMGKIPDEEETE